MKNKGIKYVKEYELDNKDKEIIKTLFEDGRYSIADIAKKTGFRRDSIMYRIKKLEENDVIIGFHPIINAPSIGYSNVTTLLLKTKIPTSDEKEIFIKKLIKIFSVVHIAIIIGKYDYQLAIVHKNTEHLYRIIEEIKLIISDFILDIEILQVIEEPKFEDMLGLVLN